MTTNIRASMLPAYFDCSRRAAAKQFKKEVERAGFTLNETQPSVGAAFGTSGHAAQEHIMRVKLETGDYGRESDALELAVERFREETAAGAVWDETTPSTNAAHFQLRRVVAAIYDFALTVNPEAVEMELLSNAGDGFELSGHIDLRTQQAAIRDLKLGALHRPYEAQVGGYSMLSKSAGLKVSALAIDWIERAPRTLPQPPVQTVEYNIGTCERAAWATIKRIKRDVEEFRKTGDPWSFPASNMSLMCNAKYCPAFNTNFCDMGRDNHD